MTLLFNCTSCLKKACLLDPGNDSMWCFWCQINNAGTNFRRPTVDYTAEEFSKIMATNFDSAYHLCQVAHPLLKASGAGSIIFISSVAGVVSLGTGSIYAATKGWNFDFDFFPPFLFNIAIEKTAGLEKPNALHFFWSGAMNQVTKNLACEWAKDNIRSNSIAPWYIRTSLVENVIKPLPCLWSPWGYDQQLTLTVSHLKHSCCSCWRTRSFTTG